MKANREKGKQNILWHLPMLASALGTIIISACGGGGGGSGSSGSASVTLSGVVATGAAVSNANITVTCVSGSSTTTADAAGTYSTTFTATLPCVLRATGGSSTLHSLAATGGTVHITPLTELLVAQLTGQEPAVYFSNPSGLATTVTSGNIASGTTAVIATLNSAGIDTTGVSNLVGGSLSAGSGSGYDGVLDTLATSIASGGTTLGELAGRVASTVAGSSATSASDGDTSSFLSANLLLKPRASTCDSLRSGDFRYIVLKASSTTGSADPVTTWGTGVMDATAQAGPTVTYDNNPNTTQIWTPVTGQACRYTFTNVQGTADITVAPSGIVVARQSGTQTPGESAPDPNFRLAIALPTQTFSVADFAGTWNIIGWRAFGGSYVIDPAIAINQASGSTSLKCANGNPATPEVSCTTSGPYTGFTARSDGTFDLTIGTEKYQMFPYRAGNGQSMAVMLKADGTMEFVTRYRTRMLPNVGATLKWANTTVDANSVAGDAQQFYEHAINATDSTAMTFTRTVTSLGASVSHPQVIQMNKARNGWTYRAAGSTTDSNGATVAIREMYSLDLGLGIATYYLPATNGVNSRFGVSVRIP